MIGIADPKLWNLGVGILSKWNGLSYCFLFIKKKAKKICGRGILYLFCPFRISFFVLRLVILPQPGLGRIAEQVKY